MKLYNPFRWHAIEMPNKQYAVRRRSFSGFWWNFLDMSGDGYVWDRNRYIVKYCLTTDRDKAITLALQYRQSGKVIWP